MTLSAFSPWSKFAGVVEEIEDRGWGEARWSSATFHGGGVGEVTRSGLFGMVVYPGAIHELSAAETKACARDAAGSGL